MDQREHIYYFDYLRIVGLFSVIFMHTAANLLRAAMNLDWVFLNLCTSFAFTAVPLFFMMSGYLLLSSKKTLDVTSLFRKRLPRLVLPLITWTVVASAWFLFQSGSFTLQAFVSQLVSAFSSPVMIHFWYMYTLIAIYLISPLLYAGLNGLDKKGKLLIFVLIVLVSIQEIGRQLTPASIDRFINFDIINKMQFFGGHLCTFFLGYYLGSSKRTVPNWLLITLICLCLGGITAGTYVLTKLHGGYDATLQNQSAGVEILLAACVFLFFKQNLNKKLFRLNDLLRPLVSLSFPIYLAHTIVLGILLRLGIDARSFLGTVGITVLVLLICFVVTMAVTFIRPLCFPVNGLSASDARISCRWHKRDG